MKKNTFKRVLMLIAGLALMLTLFTGCALEFTSRPQKPVVPLSEAQPEAEPLAAKIQKTRDTKAAEKPLAAVDPASAVAAAPTGEGSITMEQAKALALSHAGLTTATFIDHECRLDGYKYELEFFTDDAKYEYEVDARTGNVIELDTVHFAAAAPSAGEEGITLEQAKALALSHAGLTTATFIDHECRLDGYKYELEFFTDDAKYEYEVDARTGAVLEADTERHYGSFSGEYDRDWDDDHWDDWDDDDRWDD